MAEHRMMSAITSSSKSSSKKYDVFLSFRGEDTRMNFTSHLHEALNQKKVQTYIDYKLKKGDEISPALIKAIEDSHVSVVILSENYASSKWCLEELCKILECKKNQAQILIPIFYNIDPSHVRKQVGSYEQAFAKHEREGETRCKKWKAALTEVANLAGWDSRDRNESELLKDIVGDILQKLSQLAPKYSDQFKGLVGIENNYGQIVSLLEIGSSEVRTLGIWGTGGIGKTTLATALYAKLSPEFEVGCFLANVNENSSSRDGLEALRNKLFAKLLENENHCFDAPSLVPDFVMRRLGHKKVFIVLDDVATIQQLEYLIEDYDLLGPGSRVIVTTRNKQIFSRVDKIYKVKELSFDHSLELFCLTVFREKQPKHGYQDLSRSAVSYCKGIPLALKVIGGSLRHHRNKEAWESELRKLQNIPNMEIHKILKLSYDGLDYSQKDIFLDIACFFKGEGRDFVTSVLEACELFAASGIEVLLDKALITISNNNDIEMHDLIQQMGLEIVHQESIKEPGRRSRIWKHEEVRRVLMYNEGTDVVEGITLDLRQLTEDLYLSSNSFTKMTNMRFLRIRDSCRRRSGFNLYFPNGLESLSNKLRYLHWDGFCLGSLPSNFCAEQLVELHMPGSKLRKLWDGIQNLVNLKEIDLENCKDLIEIPDLSKAGNLEIVSLRGCREIESLNVRSKSLDRLFLDGCSSLKELSVTSEEITRLVLSDTAIRALPSSIWHNTKLTHLFLMGCKNLEKLLDNSGTRSISAPKNLSSLPLLWLDDCRKLLSLPEELAPSLERVSACNCISLETHFTQHLVLQHMLERRIPYKHEHPEVLFKDYEHFIFPGDHIIDECGYSTAGNSITIPYLQPSHLWGFIYCIILSKGFYDGNVWCSIYQDGIQDNRGACCSFNPSKNLISNHMLFSCVKIHPLFSDMQFKFEFKFFDTYRRKFDDRRIKECGVFPVYASESGFKLFGSGGTKEIFESESITQISNNESLPRATGVGVGGSCNENELDSITQTSDISQSRAIGVGVEGSNNEDEWEQLLHVLTSSVFF